MSKQPGNRNEEIKKQPYLRGEFGKYELAKHSFAECLGYLDLYEQGLKLFADNQSIFEIVVSKGFTITYSRPFTNGNPSVIGSGMISTKWLKRLPAAQLALHNDILRGRNSLVAHFDAENLNPKILVKDGPHNALVYNWDMVMISANTLPDLRGLVSSAHEFCSRCQQEIKPTLTHDCSTPLVFNRRRK